MKRLFFVLGVFISTLSFAQVNDGGKRICGEEFSSFGLTGKTFSEALDFAGQTHNDYQDFVLNQLATDRSDFMDTTSLKKKVYGSSIVFFQKRGMEFDESVYQMGLAKRVTLEFPEIPADFSNEAQNLLMEFQGTLKDYDEQNDGIFFERLAKLKSAALELASDKEVFAVGVPISVAIYSYKYWKENGQKWMDLFTERISPGENIKGPAVASTSEIIYSGCKVNLWHLGGADATGAVSGAMGGSALGPGGALAIGVLVSSGTSLTNLTNQVINCFVSWWPF